MRQGVKFTEVWHIMQFSLVLLLVFATWYHALIQTQHIQEWIDWPSHINRYYHHHLYAHNSSYLYYIEWIIRWYQTFSSKMPLLFKNYSRTEITNLLMRFSNTKSFLWNRSSTNTNGVNKQNTHTHKHNKHSEKNDNIRKG